MPPPGAAPRGQLPEAKFHERVVVARCRPDTGGDRVGWRRAGAAAPCLRHGRAGRGRRASSSWAWPPAWSGGPGPPCRSASRPPAGSSDRCPGSRPAGSRAPGPAPASSPGWRSRCCSSGRCSATREARSRPSPSRRARRLGAGEAVPGAARLVYGEQKWLWLAALAFHWSFLVVLLRHLRFFIEPTPAWWASSPAIDGFFQVGAPVLYVTDIVLLAALGYLLVRRLSDPQVRYISLFPDYFALFLLLGLVVTGVLMRYFVAPGHRRHQAAGARARDLRPGGAGAGQPAVLRPPVPAERARRLLPVQQADAHGRRLPEPDAEPGQQQPDAPAREPVELPGEGPHLRGVGRGVPRQDRRRPDFPSRGHSLMADQNAEPGTADPGRLPAARAGLAGSARRIPQGDVLLQRGAEEPHATSACRIRASGSPSTRTGSCRRTGRRSSSPG